MNIKKLAVGVMSSAMILTMGVGSYATSEVQEGETLSTAIQIVSASIEDGNTRIHLTEEQLAEKQAEIEAQNAKWSALSEAEKQEVYEITASSREVLKELVQKYVELELIDQEEADQILERLEEQATREQEADCMPLGMGFGGGMKGFGKINMAREIIDATETTPAIEAGEEA